MATPLTIQDTTFDIVSINRLADQYNTTTADVATPGHLAEGSADFKNSKKIAESTNTLVNNANDLNGAYNYINYLSTKTLATDPKYANWNESQKYEYKANQLREFINANINYVPYELRAGMLAQFNNVNNLIEQHYLTHPQNITTPELYNGLVGKITLKVNQEMAGRPQSEIDAEIASQKNAIIAKLPKSVKDVVSPPANGTQTPPANDTKTQQPSGIRTIPNPLLTDLTQTIQNLTEGTPIDENDVDVQQGTPGDQNADDIAEGVPVDINLDGKSYKENPSTIKTKEHYKLAHDYIVQTTRASMPNATEAEKVKACGDAINDFVAAQSDTIKGFAKEVRDEKYYNNPGKIKTEQQLHYAYEEIARTINDGLPDLTNEEFEKIFDIRKEAFLKRADVPDSVRDLAENGIFAKIGGALVGTLTSVASNFKDGTDNVVDGVQAAAGKIQDIGGALVDGMQTVAGTVKDGVEAGANALEGGLNKMKDGLEDVGSKIGSGVKKAIKKVDEFLDNPVAELLSDAAINLVSNFIPGGSVIVNLFRNMFDALLGKNDESRTTSQSALDVIKGTLIDTIVDKAAQKIKGSNDLQPDNLTTTTDSLQAKSMSEQYNSNDRSNDRRIGTAYTAFANMKISDTNKIGGGGIGGTSQSQGQGM